MRNYGGIAYITVADVTFEQETTITDLHWWAVNEECFNWSGFDDVLIFADAAGMPGTVDILNPGPYPDNSPYFDIPNLQAYYNGEVIFGGEYEVLIYTIDLSFEDTPAPITLDAGTYWIGMRPVGTLYDRSFNLHTAGEYGQPLAQTADDPINWSLIDGADLAFCLTYFSACPTANIVSADPPSGTYDARKPHRNSVLTPCYGFGMPDDPGTGSADESTFLPITIDLGVTGAGALECWSICETPDMSTSNCGANSIVNVTDNGDGTYLIELAHGVAAGYIAGVPTPAITTIQYNGGDYVEYVHHPANVDGSLKADSNDIIAVVNCLNSGTCPNYKADTDVSNIQGANDIIEQVDMLNGANQYEPWFGTDYPVNTGDCP
jgi:hypothetical protein